MKSRRLEKVHDDLELTFRPGLDELDEKTRQLYIALAIFKDDEAIPQVGIERLWQGLFRFDVEATEDLLDDLATRALLQINRSSRVVRLDCVRYLLIRTSVNSIAGNYIPEIIARAVEAGLWTTRRALSVTAKIPNEIERARMCIVLLGTARLKRNFHPTYLLA